MQMYPSAFITLSKLARAPDSAHAETCIEKEADEKKGGFAGEINGDNVLEIRVLLR